MYRGRSRALVRRSRLEAEDRVVRDGLAIPEEAGHERVLGRHVDADLVEGLDAVLVRGGRPSGAGRRGGVEGTVLPDVADAALDAGVRAGTGVGEARVALGEGEALRAVSYTHLTLPTI